MRAAPVLLLSLAILMPQSTIANAFNCTGPFMCTESMVRKLSMTPASRWYTLTPGASQQYTGSLTWLNKNARCCRHCVWDLGYPLADPIVLASDRTVGFKAVNLDCIRFQVLAENFEHTKNRI